MCKCINESFGCLKTCQRGVTTSRGRCADNSQTRNDVMTTMSSRVPARPVSQSFPPPAQDWTFLLRLVFLLILLNSFSDEGKTLLKGQLTF